MELSWYRSGKGNRKSSGQSNMYSVVFQSAFSIKVQYKFGTDPIGFRPFLFSPKLGVSLVQLYVVTGFNKYQIPFQLFS